MIQTPPRTILEVFESLPEGTLAQIINDSLVMSPAPDFEHQDVASELLRLVGNYVKEKKLGKVVIAPVDVYLNPENVYQPDILFLSSEQMHLVKKGKIKGAPDLIIEVLSPGTEKFDKTVKKSVYEQSGVKEYWIVDPKTRKVLGYQLTGSTYTEIPSEDGVITSPLLNTTVHF
jgi:Uma2 family endonuclease